MIRARPGEAAEMVATKLDSRIRAHLKQQNNLFSHTSGTLSFQRPRKFYYFLLKKYPIL